MNRILVLLLSITTVQAQFQKLVGILNREIEGRNNFEILTDEEYAGIDSNDLSQIDLTIIFQALHTHRPVIQLTVHCKKTNVFEQFDHAKHSSFLKKICAELIV